MDYVTVLDAFAEVFAQLDTEVQVDPANPAVEYSLILRGRIVLDARTAVALAAFIDEVRAGAHGARRPRRSGMNPGRRVEIPSKLDTLAGDLEAAAKAMRARNREEAIG